jgi:AcrR family transcriptional regulator
MNLVSKELGGSRLTENGVPHSRRRRADSREQAQRMQRARVLNAMAQLAAERGLRRVTVSSVLARSGVARATFYDLFESLDACFLALLDEAMGRSTELMSRAFAGEDSWPDGIVAALAALLAFFDAEPVLARVCLVESLAGGATALERRARKLRVLAPLLDASQDHASRNGREPPLNATGIVAAVAGVLHDRLITGEAPPFFDQLKQLTRFVLAQHLAEESVEEMLARAEQLAQEFAPERSMQPALNHAEVPLPKILHHPNAFRARSCVLYLADHSGASNQAIAVGVALSHHGQMSALLRRLEHGGLLSKRAGGAGRPNAWTLTPEGLRAARALETHAPTDRCGSIGSVGLRKKRGYRGHVQR